MVHRALFLDQVIFYRDVMVLPVKTFLPPHFYRYGKIEKLTTQTITSLMQRQQSAMGPDRLYVMWGNDTHSIHICFLLPGLHSIWCTWRTLRTMNAMGLHLTTTGERRVQIAVKKRLNPKTCSSEGRLMWYFCQFQCCHSKHRLLWNMVRCSTFLTPYTSASLPPMICVDMYP